MTRRKGCNNDVFNQSNSEPLESDEQSRAVCWLSKNNVVFYHVPNGGKRNWLEAVKLKRMGVKSGVPDLCIPMARKSYHGLYIELKRKTGGSLSDNQKYWLEELARQGYDTFVACGADELIEYVKNYLGESTNGQS